MRKAPYRAMNDITQQYNSGIVKIYSVEDIASPGLKPVEGLVYKGELRYEELRLGLNRYYSGKQNQVNIARVVRTQFRTEVSTQDVAVTEDGDQYRIDMKQSVPGIFPPSMDLTLATTVQEYEVPI